MNLTADSFPPVLLEALAHAHPSWHSALRAGLAAVHRADPGYLPTLCQTQFLPSEGRLFAAFAQPMDAVLYVLVGEGPYPREESATGYCFMDGAVGDLWSQEEGCGLSKKVNRATSLRNFIKMLLVAAGKLSQDNSSGVAIAGIAGLARLADSKFIQTLDELQSNMSNQGFLLLNASLVFRSDVAPVKDARAWQPFLQEIFSALHGYQQSSGVALATLVLWGKIAEQLRQIPAAGLFPQITAEHPYNLSFIGNQAMQSFFRPMNLMIRIS
ncbi:MAG: uracil-DNA glycosylase [Burkholderiales bacterium]|nr:uracil-DNA glycosylase [Burkholderiales bacterium]